MIIRVTDTNCPGSQSSLIFLALIGSVSDIFVTHWKAVSEISDISDTNDHSRLWYKLSREANVSDIVGSHWTRLWYFWYSLKSRLRNLRYLRYKSSFTCLIQVVPEAKCLWYFWYSFEASLIFLLLIHWFGTHSKRLWYFCYSCHWKAVSEMSDTNDHSYFWFS